MRASVLGSIISFFTAVAVLGWLGLVVVVVGVMFRPDGLNVEPHR